EHGMVNKAELERIRGANATGAKLDKKPSVPWGTMLKSPNMWAIMCAYFTYVYCLWIFLSWLPSYLVDARGLTLLKVGFLGSLPRAFSCWVRRSGRFGSIRRSRSSRRDPDPQ